MPRSLRSLQRTRFGRHGGGGGGGERRGETEWGGGERVRMVLTGDGQRSGHVSDETYIVLYGDKRGAPGARGNRGRGTRAAIKYNNPHIYLIIQ